jgi:cryptochrome
MEIDYDYFAMKCQRDLEEFCKERKIKLYLYNSHTIYDPIEVIRLNKGKAPLTMTSFLKAVKDVKVPEPLESPSKLPPLPNLPTLLTEKYCDLIDVPTLEQVGKSVDNPSPHKGGETIGLDIMKKFLNDKKRVKTFEKPKTSPVDWDPYSTTVLSPHLKNGSVSSRLFLKKLREVYKTPGTNTQPPVSLEGQVMWREFYYAAGVGTPNFHQMKDNPICLQVGWNLAGPSPTNYTLNPAEARPSVHKDEELAMQHLKAWQDGQTGYPWIDACMAQLNQEGWIHHLARHAVACFLTRGDLYISWERGAEYFDQVLLDADYFLNNGNWMWLSASAFFHQYFRVYSPVKFPQSNKNAAEYVKKYVPALKNMPVKYLFEPWEAPIQVQKDANCILGKDYPKRIVNHDTIHKENMNKMKEAFAARRGEVVDEDDVKSAVPKGKKNKNTEQGQKITKFFKKAG